MRRRNHRVRDRHDTRLPLVVFMGGGYVDPIEPTLDAFEDLFRMRAPVGDGFQTHKVIGTTCGRCTYGCPLDASEG